MRVQFFDEKVEKFIFGLEKIVLAKTLRTIDLLEHFGPELGMPHSKKIRGQLFELRVRGRQEVRLLYVFHKNSITILSGFIKKQQRIPLRELILAEQKLLTLDNI